MDAQWIDPKGNEVCAAVFRKPIGPLGINPKYKRQMVESNDGGTVSVDWFR